MFAVMKLADLKSHIPKKIEPRYPFKDDFNKFFRGILVQKRDFTGRLWKNRSQRKSVAF